MMNLFTQKITLFLMLGLLVIGIGIPYAFYAGRRDVTGMTTAFLLVSILLAVVAIALDRLAVQFLSPGWVSGGEFLILLVSVLYYSNNNRTMTLDLTGNPSPYFVIVWTKEPPAAPVAESGLLFNQTIAFSMGTVAPLGSHLFSITTVKAPAHWNGQFSMGMKLTHPRFESAYFYGDERYLDKRMEVDSLLKQAVGSQ